MFNCGSSEHLLWSLTQKEETHPKPQLLPCHLFDVHVHINISRVTQLIIIGYSLVEVHVGLHFLKASTHRYGKFPRNLHNILLHVTNHNSLSQIILMSHCSATQEYVFTANDILSQVYNVVRKGQHGISVDPGSARIHRITKHFSYTRNISKVNFIFQHSSTSVGVSSFQGTLLTSKLTFL